MMIQVASTQRARPRRATSPQAAPRPAICTKNCPICGCRFIARDSLADYEIFCKECGD
jgi:hypothetical protein